MNDTNVKDLNAEIANLEALELKLSAIDAEELDSAKKNELADKLHECAMNLTKLRTADLKNLSEAFKAREPELRTTTGKLKDDLRELEDAVEIINTVSGPWRPLRRLSA